MVFRRNNAGGEKELPRLLLSSSKPRSRLLSKRTKQTTYFLEVSVAILIFIYASSVAYIILSHAHQKTDLTTLEVLRDKQNSHARDTGQNNSRFDATLTGASIVPIERRREESTFERKTATNSLKIEKKKSSVQEDEHKNYTSFLKQTALISDPYLKKCKNTDTATAHDKLKVIRNLAELQPSLVNRNESIPISFLCLLDQNNSIPFWFHYFPHGAQSLLPCFSFHERMKEMLPNMNDDIEYGVWTNNYDNKKRRLSIHNRQLKYLSATVFSCQTTDDAKFPSSQVVDDGESDLAGGIHWIAQSNVSTVVVFRPGNKAAHNWRNPPWFEFPRDATALQDRFFLHSPTSSRDKYEKNEELIYQEISFTIGLIQRKTNRLLANIDEMKRKLRKKYPYSKINQVYMEDMAIQEQAIWWHQQDLVIAVHGAALMNMLYMDTSYKKPAIVEIFPPDFYELDYFLSLSKSMGIRHRQWIPSHLNRTQAMDLYLSSNAKTMSKMKKQFSFTPPADEIMGLVEEILSAPSEIAHVHVAIN